MIGYNPLTGLKENSKIFIEENNSLARFFVYPDTRNNPKYEPFYTPHLLEKHWVENPDTRNQTIFFITKPKKTGQVEQMKPTTFPGKTKKMR